MSPRLSNPETGQRIQVHSLRDFDRIARETAGLPGYKMDDPQRPFTEEYEAPAEETSEVPNDVPAQKIQPIMRPGDEHADRTSDAARDQGWGPVELPPKKDEEPKKYTKEQEKRNSRQFEANHLRLGQEKLAAQGKAILEMSADEKANTAERFRRLKHQLPGSVAIAEIAQVEPVQLELPVKSIER